MLTEADPPFDYWLREECGCAYADEWGCWVARGEGMRGGPCDCSCHHETDPDYFDPAENFAMNDELLP